MTETMITKVRIERTIGEVDFFFTCKLETRVNAETREFIDQELYDTNLVIWANQGSKCIFNGTPSDETLEWFQSELDEIDIRDMEYSNDKGFNS